MARSNRRDHRLHPQYAGNGDRMELDYEPTVARPPRRTENVTAGGEPQAAVPRGCK
jgi:hypothetical protein